MAKSALKFKDSVAEYERIAAEIAARRFSGIYLLMGEESYFIDALSDQLAATILDEAARAFNQITVYGRDSEAGQVINLCRQMPMMGQYQVVILKEAQQLKGLDKLALYTQKPSPTTILVICHKEKNADKRSAFYKGCAANGTVLESVRPRDYEIAAWLQQFIRQKGFTIDPKALSMLTDHLGTDIAKISNEIRKLTVSLPEGTQRITDADIEANIGISKDFNNFELCKAVVTRDMGRALMIADHFARNPKENPLLLTIMALFGQFRDLFVVNYLPYGLDATVSWPGPDYKFRNDRDYPVKIVAYCNDSDNSITVEIWGTDVDGSYVELTSGYGYRYDSTYPDVVIGYSAVSYRNIYDKDGNLIDRVFEASSSYDLHENEIKWPDPSESPSPSDSGSTDPSTEPSTEPPKPTEPSPDPTIIIVEGNGNG